MMASMQEIDSVVIQRLQQENAELQQQNTALKALLLRHKGFIEETPFVTQQEWLAKSFELFSDTIALLKGEQKEKK